MFVCDIQMRVILFNDMSIVISEVSVSLHTGDNYVKIPTIGHISGTLYIRSKYPYTMADDTTINIISTEDVPTYTFSYVYTTNTITGHVQYTYDDDEVHATYIVDADIDTDDMQFGIGTTLWYRDQDHHTDSLEYSLLHVPPQSPIPHIDGEIVYVVDESMVYKVLSLHRSNEAGTRPLYPGILIYGNNESAIVDRDNNIVCIQQVDDIHVESTDSNTIFIDNNMDPYIDIVLTMHDTYVPSAVSVHDDSGYPIETSISTVKDEVQIKFSTTGVGSYTVSI